MTDGASQIFPMLSPSVLKHLRSNGCPSSPSCHNAPNTMARWANSLTGSDKSTSHLIPTIWAHSDAIDVGRCQRELLRPVPCIHHAFCVVWNTLKAMDVPPPYYVTNTICHTRRGPLDWGALAKTRDNSFQPCGHTVMPQMLWDARESISDLSNAHIKCFGCFLTPQKQWMSLRLTSKYIICNTPRRGPFYWLWPIVMP